MANNECLRILQCNFCRDTCSFASNKVILEALRTSSIGQTKDFRQTLELCMPFIMFKKDEAVAIGAHALDLKLPFEEIEVLQENLDLIKRQIDLEEVKVWSATNPVDVAKAGSFVKLIEQNPSFPGSPTAIFLTR